MSTTEEILTAPTQPHLFLSPMGDAIETATTRGHRRFAPAHSRRNGSWYPFGECPTPAQIQECTTPEQAAEYWKLHADQLYFNPDVEFFVVILLNTRMRIKGHVIVGMGILDSVLVHPREVFRVAIVASAYAVLVMHNHPGGDPTLRKRISAPPGSHPAGQLLKIEVVDHVIMGQATPERIRSYSSLKELGRFIADRGTCRFSSLSRQRDGDDSWCPMDVAHIAGRT